MTLLRRILNTHSSSPVPAYLKDFGLASEVSPKHPPLPIDFLRDQLS